MDVKALQQKIRDRWNLQNDRNQLLEQFSGMDPQNMTNPAQLMGLLPKLPDMKAAYEKTREIETLSDQIIQGFIQLNANGEADHG
ncbi:MAG: hypothetical protein CL537_07775 [Alcanivoracaceae bacterium]|nr:hypothetical protein [Alcanivoracaceae bacterium]|tara:strand:- start:2971 stop:3225 length:255 start_codon:yes stop_codon:yes gene_type:complete